jgi:DNA-binding GntR family transcriptional regulator
MRETFGLEDFYSVLYLVRWHTPDFVKFSVEENRTTWERISHYLEQLGEVGSIDALKVRLFSLSLTGTAFS